MKNSRRAYSVPRLKQLTHLQMDKILRWVGNILVRWAVFQVRALQVLEALFMHSVTNWIKVWHRMCFRSLGSSRTKKTRILLQAMADWWSPVKSGPCALWLELPIVIVSTRKLYVAVLLRNPQTTILNLIQQVMNQIVRAVEIMVDPSRSCLNSIRKSWRKKRQKRRRYVSRIK